MQPRTGVINWGVARIRLVIRFMIVIRFVMTVVVVITVLIAGRVEAMITSAVLARVVESVCLTFQ